MDGRGLGHQQSPTCQPSAAFYKARWNASSGRISHGSKATVLRNIWALPRIVLKVMSTRRPNIVNVLRETLLRLEPPPGVSPDDPAVRQMRSSVVRALAELQMNKPELQMDQSDAA